MAKRQIKREIRVFYAWQDDLPGKFNRYGLKKALSIASAEISHELSSAEGPTEITIDEATRDLPGSPNIPASIQEKIQLADIFIGDVSIIGNQNGKATPNPNVTFELGFAVANLGWDRVILSVNEIHGQVKLLPFDFDRHRAMTFRLGSGVGNVKELTSRLREAIALIIEKNPPRPKAGKLDLPQMNHERDLKNLNKLLGSLHWPTIKEHISSGPQFLTRAAVDFYDEVIEMTSSPLFHIYDTELADRIRLFIKHWSGSLEYDHYAPSRSGHGYVFHSSTNATEIIREQKHWSYMQAERLKMHSAMQGLLNAIRANFPEIDLEELSDAAARRYDREIAEIRKRFERSLPDRGKSSREPAQTNRKGTGHRRS